MRCVVLIWHILDGGVVCLLGFLHKFLRCSEVARPIDNWSGSHVGKVKWIDELRRGSADLGNSDEVEPGVAIDLLEG